MCVVVVCEVNGDDASRGGSELRSLILIACHLRQHFYSTNTINM